MSAMHSLRWLAPSTATSSFVLTVLLSVSCLTIIGTVAISPVTNDHHIGQHEVALNYLLYSSPNRQERRINDSKLEELLKDSNHSHVSDAVDLERAKSVWSMMRQNAKEFAALRAHEAKPTIDRLLKQANVSSECSQSLNGVIEHIVNLDRWAVESKFSNQIDSRYFAE